MTSRTISFLLLSLTMLVLAACGSDDPTFPDQRTLTTKQLAHVVKGGTPQVNKVDFRFSFDTRALTASVQLGSIDAGPTTIGGLTLALDEDENRYEIKPGAGTDARVSGLHGIYDPNEGVVWLDYVVDGNTAVHLTPTSLFYMNNTTTVGVEGRVHQQLAAQPREQVLRHAHAHGLHHRWRGLASRHQLPRPHGQRSNRAAHAQLQVCLAQLRAERRRRINDGTIHAEQWPHSHRQGQCLLTNNLIDT